MIKKIVVVIYLIIFFSSISYAASVIVAPSNASESAVLFKNSNLLISKGLYKMAKLLARPV